MGTLPQALFFLREMGPVFLEAPNLGRAHIFFCGASKVHQAFRERETERMEITSSENDSDLDRLFVKIASPNLVHDSGNV